MSPPRLPRLFTALGRLRGLTALGLWGAALLSGFYVLVNYELKAGAPSTPPESWPVDAALPFDRQRVNLVMFAHPQCPCSRASVAELATIMTRCEGKLNAVVAFFGPEEEPESWVRSQLWRSAAAIPGVKVLADRNGTMAESFGSVTSGQVLLFERDGRRIFSGGITGARGHQGPNRGRDYVIALARGELCDGSMTAVFGCSLHDPESSAATAP